MNQITADPLVAHPRTAPARLRSTSSVLIAGAIVIGAVMGGALMVAVADRPAAVAAPAGVAVTDGWAHSPITRSGVAGAGQGVAVTDGWAHSPITRYGADDAGASRLRSLATLYETHDPAAEARAR